MLARRAALFFSHLGFLAPTPRSYNYWDRESTKAFSSLYVKVTHVTSIYIMFAKTRLSTVAKVWQAANTVLLHVCPGEKLKLRVTLFHIHHQEKKEPQIWHEASGINNTLPCPAANMLPRALAAPAENPVAILTTHRAPHNHPYL